MLRHAHARHMLALLATSLTAAWVCAGTPAALNRTPTNEQVIRQVFGVYGSQAVAVARCESGLSVWARNGQYENIFQMGYNERRTYGWHTVGSPAIVAARAAYRYFVASGHSWRAWECKPW